MRPLAALLLAPVLVAQQPASRSALHLDQWLWFLRGNRFGTWLVLPGSAKDLAADRWRARLLEDPMVELNLPLAVLDPGSPAEQELREREGWGPGTHWALVGPRGDVRGHAEGFPAAEALRDLAESGGLGWRIKEIRDFLRLNPDHLEGRRLLMVELQGVATRRTRLELAPKAARPAGEAKEPDARPTLPDARDAAIWGEVVRLWEGFMAGSDWLETDTASLATAPGAGEASPLMRAAAAKQVGRLERILERAPTDQTFWRIHLALLRCVGGRPLRPFVERLVAPPGAQPGRWLPAFVQQAVIEECRSREDWQGLKGFLEPILLPSLGPDQAFFDFNLSLRDACIGLVESYLRLGDTSRAQSVLDGVALRQRSGGLYQDAAALAERLKLPGLAEQWRRQAEAAGSGRPAGGSAVL